MRGRTQVALSGVIETSHCTGFAKGMICSKSLGRVNLQFSTVRSVHSGERWGLYKTYEVLE